MRSLKSRRLAAVISLTVLSSPAFATVIVDVTPTSPNGWSFSNTDNSGTNASGAFVLGPSVPPLGAGSAQLLVGDPLSSEILIQTFLPTSVGSLGNLSYSTYVTTSTLGSGSAPTLQFDLFQGTTYAGRLVFDPGLLGTVAFNTWQYWDASGGADAWFLTKSSTMFGGSCFLNNGNYCTFAEAAALLDARGINAVDNLFKAGSNQASFNGNVDGYTRNVITYNFDTTSVPEPMTLSMFGAGVVGMAALRRRRKNAVA